METRFFAVVEAYEPATDAHNRAVDSWGAPPREVPIYGWEDTASDQAVAGNRQPVTSQVTVYAPAGTATATRDRWTLPDGTVLLQDGDIKDFTNGPWPFGGVVVRLQRVRG